MQITKSDFEKIKEYLLGQLLIEQPSNRAFIIGTLKMCTLGLFLESIKEKKEKRKPLPTEDDKGFREFWNEYPPSGNFTYRGMSFISSRVLRSNYQVCEMLYMKALTENNVTPEQMLKAIKKQVSIAKKESYETGQNKIAYMPGLEVYIRQAKYLAFITEYTSTENEDNEEQDSNINCG